MKKNGFTLVELLAVIVILSILITIVTIIVNPIVEKSKNKLSKIQIEYIENSANAYYLKEGGNNEYEGSSFEMCVDLSYLIENDYIENEEILNPKDYEKLDGSVKITYKSEQFSYKYNESNCSYKYQSIDNVCTLVNDVEPLGISIGDKYQCKVKDSMEEDFEGGYYFYVLSFEDNKTVNLIMDRNINSDGTVAKKAILESEKTSNDGIYNLVAWINEGDYEIEGGLNWDDWVDNNTFGPVTAMNFLNNATSTWENIPNLNITYDDAGIFTNFKVTGKARLPYHSEVNDTGCLNYEDFSCPVWMIDYLTDTSPDYNAIYQENPIAEINGYWTFSAYAASAYNAWDVECIGYVASAHINKASINGVRPVINLPRNELQIKVPM